MQSGQLGRLDTVSDPGARPYPSDWPEQDVTPFDRGDSPCLPAHHQRGLGGDRRAGRTHRGLDGAQHHTGCHPRGGQRARRPRAGHGRRRDRLRHHLPDRLDRHPLRGRQPGGRRVHPDLARLRREEARSRSPRPGSSCSRTARRCRPRPRPGPPAVSRDPAGARGHGRHVRPRRRRPAGADAGVPGGRGPEVRGGPDPVRRRLVVRHRRPRGPAVLVPGHRQGGDGRGRRLRGGSRQRPPARAPWCRGRPSCPGRPPRTSSGTGPASPASSRRGTSRVPPSSARRPRPRSCPCGCSRTRT